MGGAVEQQIMGIFIRNIFWNRCGWFDLYQIWSFSMTWRSAYLHLPDTVYKASFIQHSNNHPDLW